MSNELAKINDSSITSLDSIEANQRIFEKLMKTKHFAKMGEEGVYAIITKARSLGICPIDALSGGIYYVQGKTGMSSEMMASLIRQAGHSIIKDAKSDNSVCILHGKRKDNGDTWTVSFSIEDARRAGLMKNMYEKYPSIMLYNRAMSMLARQLYPDVIKGAGYTMDELKEIAHSKEENHSSEIIEIKEEKISKTQIEELTNVLSKCDDEYKKQVWNFWKRQYKIASLGDLPAHTYDDIIKGALTRIQDNIRNKLEEEKVVEEVQDVKTA